MDSGPGETMSDEGPDQSNPTTEMNEQGNAECGSPMQQSPDQSNFNDNYRSPENVDPTMEEEFMDTNENKPDSPDVGMEGVSACDNEQENDTGKIENIDNTVEEAERTDTDDQVTESNQPLQMSPEVDSGREDIFIQDNDVLPESVSENLSSEVTNNEESIVEKDINESENNAAESVEHESCDEKDCRNDDIINVEPSKTSEESNDVGQSEVSPPLEESDLKESNLGLEGGNDNDIIVSKSQLGVVDTESILEKSQSPGSQEVSSTSFDKDLSAKIDSVSENLDKTSVLPSVQDSDSFKSPSGGIFQTKKLGYLNIDTLGSKENMSASSSVDNFSTTSLKGSTDSDEDISDFDLTKPDEDIAGDHQDKDKDTENDQDNCVENVSSSTSNVLDKNIMEQGESDLVNREENVVEDESAESISQEPGMQEEKLIPTYEEKKLDDSLEEVSDEEDENIDERVDDTPKEKQQGSLSGMEEVSSDEEGEEGDDDNDGKEKKAESGMEEVSDDDDEIQGDDESRRKEYQAEAGEKEEDKEKKLEVESGMEEVSDEEEEPVEDAIEEEKKVESGMEEVSEEEEESEGENSSGVENVSSDEEGEELKAAEDDKIDASRTVEVKQSGETVAIDDTGKEDGAIVKEMLDNMTIKIENNSNEEKTEVVDKRRKSKDKKDRRESAKSKTKSHVKDTRDINERLKAQASYGDDVELDYDDTVHDESKDKQASESEGEITSDSSSSDGEIEEEECEEGEIKEPGQRPYVKPTCRFFMRGHCTWGINCRFLHPGVNDKGNYQLIERPGFNNKPPPPFEEKWEEEEPERSPTPEPPPPPPEPKEETAWERGLRQAKELRKKALERREMETNFEHKKMNLSIEDNPEYDKENVDEVIEKPPKKSPVKKTPYYDKYEPLSDDEYYDQTPMRLQQKQMEQSWMSGQYENFEVHWTQDQYGPPQGSYPQHMSRYPYQQDQPVRNRDRMPLRPSPRRFSMSPPPAHNQRQMRPPQREPQEVMRRDKIREQRMSPPPQRQKPGGPGRPKADDWNDPWTRANAAKGKSPKKRSRSRGRRRSRRSHSYSSYSSSSYSGSSRSRSRSSSYSSISSRSSSRSSVSRSRSPVPRRGGMRRPVPGGNQPVRRPSTQGKPNEPPRSSVAVHGRGDRPGDRRPGGALRSGGMPSSPTKGARGAPPMQGRYPPGRQPPGKQPPSRSLGQQIADVGRGKRLPQKSAPPSSEPQRKFQMAVKSRDRPLPQSALTKDKGKPMSGPGARKRKTSSSSSRSRSRSRSSSSSSRSSYSSRSSFSRSRSRSSSTSSSGSADSDHLYRNIGSNRGNQKAAPSGRPNPGAMKHGRGPSGGRPGQGRPNVKPGETSRPSTLAQAKVVKDPLKMTGLKSNIKLTLIKQSDKPPPGSGPEPVSRKRPAEAEGEAPPQKRPAPPNPSKIDKPAKKPEKAAPVSPTKAPGRPPGPGKPGPGVSAPPAAGATAAPAAVKKKSTVSRREELLKQLKAVEDAIAKKKKKMG